MTEIVEIIQPSGQLDKKNLNLLHNEILNFLSQGIKLILIDFQDITYIEYEQIENLKIILNKVHSHEGKLYICSLNEQVKTIFEITNNYHTFNPLSDREEFEEIILTTQN